jgi:hypothetical protein
MRPLAVRLGFHGVFFSVIGFALMVFQAANGDKTSWRSAFGTFGSLQNWRRWPVVELLGSEWIPPAW